MKPAPLPPGWTRIDEDAHAADVLGVAWSVAMFGLGVVCGVIAAMVVS